MAASAVQNVDEFVNCEVCWCRYDEIVRKPKFLQCSHTVCLLCLQIQNIFKNGKIICPVCHQVFDNTDPAVLPNNNYALYMLKLSDNNSPVVETEVASQMGLNWCVACGSVVADECKLSHHPSVILTSATVKNVDAFISLKQEFLKLKQAQNQKLFCDIERRKELADDLALHLSLVETAISDLKKQKLENDIHLNQLIALLDENSSTIVVASDGPRPEKMDFFLPELTSLAEESNSADSADTLLAKIKESVDLCEEKLRLATIAADEYDLCKGMKIKIHLYDQEDRPFPCHWLDQGFSLTFGRKTGRRTKIKQELYLLSHIVFYILKRKNIRFPAMDSVSDPDEPLDSPSTAFDTASLLADIPISQDKFVLGHSVFVLWVMQSESPIAAICIRPLPDCRPDFIEKLGEFCYQSPKYFPNKATKVSSGKYAFLPVIHPDFKSLFCDTTECRPNSEKATRYGDVGINFVTTLNNRQIVGWSFTFILRESSSGVLPSSELFGRFVSYHNAIELIMSKKNDYTLCLESK